MKTNKIYLGTITLSAALLFGACASSVEEPMIEEQEEVEQPAIEETKEEREARQAPSGQGLEHLALEVTLDDALDIFFDRFGSVDINIQSIELDKDDGRYVYNIAGWDTGYDYKLTIDAETSDVIEQEKEEEDDQGDIIDVGAVISPLEAMEAALEASGSGYVEEWELEVDNNRAIYDIDISNGDDQKVDALTGEVL